MALVLGVGVGFFTLALLWAFTLLVCLMFAKAQGALQYAGLGAFLVSGLVTLILIVLPREPKVSTDEQTAVIYDYTIIYRYLLMSGCLLFLLIGLFAYLGTHVMEPIYAKSLRRIR
ncbi:transmembrane protein 218-like [Crassostrea virginica]|uniref:Transmembrane protein 218 n=1 Tax=Crassostrea virginica TaxID=6565 RepID=A0A8B8D1X3_CRAVI|nr:transmembrane protein 218-like [Crassostrea virginica]